MPRIRVPRSVTTPTTHCEAPLLPAVCLARDA
jgi:hypothetical protein